jgi:hypothetical protein
MQYEIVEAEDPVRLAVRVKEYIAAGWRPQGGLAIHQANTPANRRTEWTYAQAMVKDDAP